MLSQGTRGNERTDLLVLLPTSVFEIPVHTFLVTFISSWQRTGSVEDEAENNHPGGSLRVTQGTAAAAQGYCSEERAGAITIWWHVNGKFRQARQFTRTKKNSDILNVWKLRSTG
jgi:hypothetical protein